MQGAHHDHRNNARQEQHNDQRVHDREPMNLFVALHLEVNIPARRPADRRLLPNDRVREHDLGTGRDNLRPRVRERSACRRRVVLELGELVLDRVRLDLEPDNAVAVVCVVVVVLELERHVVVDERLGGLLVVVAEAPDRVAVFVDLALRAVLHGEGRNERCGKVVGEHVNTVIFADALGEQRSLRRVQIDDAENFARLGNLRLDLVGGVVDTVATEDLAEVLRRGGLASGLAEGERVVVVG
eukprot:Amastigsp_a53_1498.p3 type:complete len:242 gc:universal Amastigsp_a53_1498:902-177(-)